MKHRVPAPPSLGSEAGLAYALFLPEGEPSAGIVILHGAGSAKESHFDFGRAARAHGMAALAFDARGHGRSEGSFGPGAVDDVGVMCDVVRRHAPRLALRGSSLGGFLAIETAATRDDVDAVIGICPAPPELLAQGLRSGRLAGFSADREALEPWLETRSLRDAAAALAPRTALLLLHARGDEQVPYTVSEELHSVAGEPKRLLLLPGGHHRSIQHDAELQAESLRWLDRVLAGAGR